MDRHQYMPQIEVEPPLRESDCVHSHDAVLARTEELLALTRTPLSSVVPINKWFFLPLTPSAPLLAWWKSLPVTRHHLWMESAALDLLGTQIFLSDEFITRNPANPFHRPIDKPFGSYAIVCSYRQAALATAYLRHEHLGPALLTAYGADLLARTSDRIIRALELTEGSFNSVALPHYCRTQWGLLSRIDARNAGRFLCFFNIEAPVESSIPLVDDLGGALSIVCACSPAEEALRIALCPRANESSAVHDLGHCLRAELESRKKKTPDKTYAAASTR